MQYTNMYHIIRIGKKMGDGTYIVHFLQSILIMGVNFLFSIIWLGKNCERGIGWGKALHTLALTNAAQHYGFLFGVSYDSMQQYSAATLFIYTILIGALVVAFFGIFMFMLSIVWNRMASIVGAGILTAGIYLVENTHPMLSQKISMFFPTSWFRTASIDAKVHGSYVLPPVNYIFATLVVSIAFMCAIIIWRIGRIEFEWENKMGCKS